LAAGIFRGGEYRASQLPVKRSSLGLKNHRHFLCSGQWRRFGWGISSMQRFGAVLIVTAIFGAGAASAGPATSVGFQLRLPVPAVGPTQCLPPGAIAQRLTRQHFRIQKMYRKGPAYAVAAIGPSGNKVLMMVDGRSGGILGLNVLTAVVQVTPQRAPNAVFVDDRHPFGAVVPAVIYDTWQEYSETQWAVESGPIAITASFTPFHYAVPFNYVHVAPRTGRSFAVAPPRYRGYQIQSHGGRPIRDPWTRSEAADAEAAYQSERADQADFDKINAQQDSAYANGRADAFQEDNANLIAAQADAADQRTAAADQQEAETQADLEKNGGADQPCGAGDCGDVAANPDDGAAPADEAIPADDTAAPQEAPVPEEQAAPAEQPVPEEQAAPAEQPAPEEAAPQEQAAPAQDEQAAPQEQAAPEEPAPQEQAAPEEQPQDNGGGDMGGGDSGGGGDGGGGDGGGGDDGGG
jgi:uncharacterized membrane protein YgcG